VKLKITIDGNTLELELPAEETCIRYATADIIRIMEAAIDKLKSGK
jgi:hypothetical protein